MSKREVRLLSIFALLEKIEDFCADLLPNFESICEHMVEKFGNKNAKKTNFSKRMEFRKKSIVAAFDFDGTLTFCDSLPYFFCYSKGIIPALAYFLRDLPIFVSYMIGMNSRQSTKESILTRFFKGTPATRLEDLGENFAKEKIKHLLRSKSIECIQWHLKQGHRCILVSANLDVYLKPWAKMLGFHDLICSKLEFDSKGNATGKLVGKNCWGNEKLKQLTELLGAREEYCLYAYGDSKGDQEMLRLADLAFYRSLG